MIYSALHEAARCRRGWWSGRRCCCCVRRDMAPTRLLRNCEWPVKTVTRWLGRFEAQDMKGMEDAPRSGRPPLILSSKIAEIVEKTTRETPPGATHWSTRTLAPVAGVSPSTVGRIWRAHGLKPHRVSSFKLSNDPRFAEKLEDVVGLYLHPPADTIVLSLDEKCQIQALDRTQPGLPWKKGRCGTMTHDYKRHGTTTLFTAMIRRMERSLTCACPPTIIRIGFAFSS